MECLYQTGNENNTNRIEFAMLKYKSISDKYKEWQSGETVSWIVQDIIMHGANLIYSPPKHGKSYILLDLAIALATGGIWMSSYKVEQQPVIWIDEDTNNGRSTNKRLFEDFGLTDDTPGMSNIKIHEHEGFKIGDEGKRRQLIKDCIEIGCKVVIMDSLSTVGGDPTLSAKGMMAVNAAMREITQAGIAIIMLHHQSKRGKNAVGSGAIERGYDVIYRLEKANGVRMIKEVGRDSSSREFFGCDIEKSVDDNGNVVLIATEIDDPDNVDAKGGNKRIAIREAILTLLSSNYELNQTQIRNALSLPGRDLDMLKMCLNELVDDQIITPHKIGKATFYRLATETIVDDVVVEIVDDKETNGTKGQKEKRTLMLTG